MRESLNGLNICVFKPYNTRMGTAFETGQHPLFARLNSEYGHRFTYLVDASDQRFDGVSTIHLRKSLPRTFINGVRVFLARTLGGNIYCRYPYYGPIDFGEYHVIVTEGPRYSLLRYLENDAHKTILNDSITLANPLNARSIAYLNSKFSTALAVVVNQHIKSRYERSGVRLQTCVIGHGLDFSDIHYDHRRKVGGAFVTIGRLVEEKGLRYIFEAIQRLIPRYPKLRLDVFGEGPERLKLERIIRSLGLEEVICLKGARPNAVLRTLLAQYDAFVTHPITMSHIAEAFMIANIEAMAAGLPVITSDCGGVPSVVGDNALVVNERNIEGIAAAIEVLMTSPNKVAEYSERGMKFARQQYSVATIAAQWNEILHNQAGNQR